MPYFDKNGVEIKAGMFLQMGFDQPEKVYATVDADGNPDLGINASNEAYLRRHYPGYEESYREFYPLSSFNLREAEICQTDQVLGMPGLSM